MMTSILTLLINRTNRDAGTYESAEIRDAVIKSGMEHGAAESYDRLAELLEVLTPG
jgi:hypothetical protein